ncbi:unnamed protein product [Schistosoma turkestanicum]|nr:unnamed protein product [Schistosoma turkestanicum]
MTTVINTNMVEPMKTEAFTLIVRTFATHNHNEQRAECIERDFNKYIIDNLHVSDHHYECIISKYTSDLEQRLRRYNSHDGALFISLIFNNEIVFLGDHRAKVDFS